MAKKEYMKNRKNDEYTPFVLSTTDHVEYFKQEVVVLCNDKERAARYTDERNRRYDAFTCTGSPVKRLSQRALSTSSPMQLLLLSWLTINRRRRMTVLTVPRLGFST